jgi:hypothetical protein
MDLEILYSVVTHGNCIFVGADELEKNGSSDVGTVILFGNPYKDPNLLEWTQLEQFPQMI